MSNGIGSIIINNKNYSGLKIGSKYAKRLTEIIDSNSVLTINCSEGNNILKISNQLEKQIEYVKIFNINNLNEDLATEANEWILPDGTYKVYIKGEFNCVGSTCKFIEIELSEELTTGYKMFYNCNVNTANSDYEIIIPSSMTNVESMFEKSNLTATVNLDFNIIENCKNMYKDCFDLKQIGQEYINIFNNESVLAPNLIDYENCFAGCENIYCGNNNVNEDKPRLFNWKDTPIIWGGPIINMAFAYYNRYEMIAEPFTGPYVIDMNSTYWNCTSLIGSPAIGPNVINASSTYYNCRKLTGNPVCGNNVTDMSYTYTNCYKLIGNPVCGDNVTDISYAYYNCTNIAGNPVCGNNVNYMSNTYYQCYNLTGNPVCGNNVGNMSSTYQRCCNLTGSPV